MALAVLAMVLMIVCVDQLLWRPLVVWVEKFRRDDTTGGGPAPGSWVLAFLRRARLPRRAALLQRRAYRGARRAARPLERPFRAVGPVIWRAPRFALDHPLARRLGAGLLMAAVGAVALLGARSLWLLLAQLGVRDWGTLVSSATLTFARVMGAVVVSTAWALPAGVWIGRSPRLARALQAGVQVVASVPAPMLFPLVILLFERIGIGLGLGAVALMVLAGQWYILFNVISAVAAIPEQLKDAATVFRLPRLARWRALYLPAAFPALVTGWVTAAGGARNGSIVAEYIEAGGRLRTTQGLGSLISEATAHANFPLLAGGIALMSLIVVGWNRLVWRSLMPWGPNPLGLSPRAPGSCRPRGGPRRSGSARPTARSSGRRAAWPPACAGTRGGGRGGGGGAVSGGPPPAPRGSCGGPSRSARSIRSPPRICAARSSTCGATRPPA